MTYTGQSLRVTALGEGLYELCFDRQGESVNKFDAATHVELHDAVAALRACADLKGLLLSSAKGVFIAGADIFEFIPQFRQDVDLVTAEILACSRGFAALEDLPVPIVCAINGYALGGGFELALCADYRVMAAGAQVGLPEVTLGIMPGWGGTVRLPRLCGLATALDWIVGGRFHNAEEALEVGAADAVADLEALRDSALQWLRAAVAGEHEWRGRRRWRLAPYQADTALLAEARARLAPVARHQPGPLRAVDTIGSTASLPRDEALALEARAFAEIGKTEAAAAMIQVFANDQLFKKRIKEAGRRAAAAPRQPQAATAGIVNTHSPRAVADSRLVEVVQAEDSDPALLAATVADIAKNGGQPLIVRGAPGLLVYRLLLATVLGACELLRQGADRADIDRVMADWGWSPSPLALAEAAGLSTLAAIADALGLAHGDCFANRAGQALLVAPPDGGQRNFADGEILERLLLPLIVAATDCLEQGIVANPDEVDQALLLALNFPRHHCGPLKYADWLGLAQVVSRCEAWSADPAMTALYAPPPALRARARQNGRFYP
ncbi:MAG TPA: enoyl-CoA hydratase-related protein [Rhodocyclaceae bacterium]